MADPLPFFCLWSLLAHLQIYFQFLTEEEPFRLEFIPPVITWRLFCPLINPRRRIKKVSNDQAWVINSKTSSCTLTFSLQDPFILVTPILENKLNKNKYCGFYWYPPHSSVSPGLQLLSWSQPKSLGCGRMRRDRG